MDLINGVHGYHPLHGGSSLRRGLEWISSTVCMGTIPYMGVRPQGGGWNGSHQRCAWEPSLTWGSVPKEGVGMDLINGGWNGSHQRCAWEPSLTWGSVPKEGVGMDLINGVHGNHRLHGGPSLRRGAEWVSSTVCMGTIPYMGVRPQGGGLE